MNTTMPQALPNPLTPMAFLPQDVAQQITISLYVLSGTTSVCSLNYYSEEPFKLAERRIIHVQVFIWDVITHLKDDYILATHYPVKVPIIVYGVSRYVTIRSSKNWS